MYINYSNKMDVFVIDISFKKCVNWKWNIQKYILVNMDASFQHRLKTSAFILTTLMDRK